MTIIPGGIKEVPQPSGVSMHSTISKRIACRIVNTDIVPYLTTLTLVAGLLVVWAGLCAI
jgi:hypothetical protein